MAMKRILLKLSLLILLITPISSYALDYHDAKVADISDRGYEPAVIELLDNAEESILISMYVIKPTVAPVALLLNDLIEALERGVTVEIYLNTRFKTDDPFKLTEHFKELEQSGAWIYLASSDRLLHDKLIVVDERFVVEGSTNWSVSALKSNYESATIIDSPELAKEKISRMRKFLLEGAEGEKNDQARSKVKAELPDVIKVPQALLEDEQYLSEMLKQYDKRSINAYLLLIAESARTGKNEFYLYLEDFASELQMPEDWTNTAKRRQVIKILKKLSNKYELITATFTHGKDAWIELAQIPGGTLIVDSNIFDPDFLAKTSPAAKTILLIGALLEGEGYLIEDFPQKDLCQRFSISSEQFRKGMKELHSQSQTR